MNLLLKGGNVVFLNGVKKCDLFISQGKVYLGDNCPTPRKEINISGKYVFSGLVDMHVHLREPGFEGKEDISSGSSAAVKGGFTSICCMPNTNPVCDNKVVARYITSRAKEVNLCKIYPIGAITKGESGEEMSEIGSMKAEGIVAISDDGKSVMNSALMRLAMEYASGFDLKCLCHCEDSALALGAVVNEGFNSTLTGLKGSLRAAEDIMIARDIALAESLNVPVHICHVSTYSGVDIIRSAKARGVKVTAETCPHYFVLTDDAITDFDTDSKVNPPLREERDRLAVIDGLKDGTIDCIASDHAPHSAKDKQVEYNLAAFGISGIETSFSLSYTYLVKRGYLKVEDLAKKMSLNPCEILSLGGGEIKDGAVADLTVADLDAKYVIDPEKFRSKGKNTPFKGLEVYGKILYTIVDGEIKYSLN